MVLKFVKVNTNEIKGISHGLLVQISNLSPLVLSWVSPAKYDNLPNALRESEQPLKWLSFMHFFCFNFCSLTSKYHFLKSCIFIDWYKTCSELISSWWLNGFMKISWKPNVCWPNLCVLDINFYTFLWWMPVKNLYFFLNSINTLSQS